MNIFLWQIELFESLEYNRNWWINESFQLWLKLLLCNNNIPQEELEDKEEAGRGFFVGSVPLPRVKVDVDGASISLLLSWTSL